MHHVPKSIFLTKGSPVFHLAFTLAALGGNNYPSSIQYLPELVTHLATKVVRLTLLPVGPVGNLRRFHFEKILRLCPFTWWLSCHIQRPSDRFELIDFIYSWKRLYHQQSQSVQSNSWAPGWLHPSPFKKFHYFCLCFFFNHFFLIIFFSHRLRFLWCVNLSKVSTWENLINHNLQTPVWDVS